MHCTSFAEPAQAAASTANSALNQQNSKQIVKDCEAEWKANQEAMMKGGMTEDSYVQQCSVKDDVPAIPEQDESRSVICTKIGPPSAAEGAPENEERRGSTLCEPNLGRLFSRYDIAR
jgi:hypothetical protein